MIIDGYTTAGTERETALDPETLVRQMTLAEPALCLVQADPAGACCRRDVSLGRRLGNRAGTFLRRRQILP
jgi:hypothetical protein